MENQMMNPRVDEIVEHFNVSGVLHVTVDNGSVHTLMFNQHVKIHIAFNNEKLGKELDPLPIVKTESFSHDDDIIEESMHGGEEDDVGLDKEKIEHDDDPAVQKSLRDIEIVPKPSNSNVSCAKKRGPKSKGPVKNTEIKPKKAKLVKRKKGKDTNEPSKTSALARKKKSAPKKSAKVVKKSSGNTLEIAKSEPVDGISTNPDDLPALTSQTETDKPQEKFVCTYCSQSFESSSALKSHHKATPSEKFKCSKCRKSFKTKAYLMTHEMVTHAEKEASVDDSSDATDTKSKEYVCSECGKSVFCQNMRRHMLTHTGEKLYKCCVCDFQVTSAYCHLEIHMRKHIGTISNSVECRSCHVFFNSRAELAAHQLTHTFKCDLCDTIFPTKTGRNFHYQTTHKHEIVKCPTCGGIYTSEEALTAHMKYHLKKQRKQCLICGGLFVYLKQHMQVVHPDKSQGEGDLFMCDKCPKEFKSRKSFARHVNVHHLKGPEDDQRLYTCQLCSKQYSTSRGLKRHLMAHSGEKPYVCNICGKACSRAENLRGHMKIHFKEKSAPVSYVTLNTAGVTLNTAGVNVNEFSGGHISNAETEMSIFFVSK